MTPRRILSKDIAEGPYPLLERKEAAFPKENNVFSLRRLFTCRMSSEERKLYGFYSEVVTWVVWKYSQEKTRLMLHQNTRVRKDMKRCNMCMPAVFWNIFITKTKFTV
jgi:hypothetical protein